MSIIDNVAELRARLAEIEAEKSAALSGTDWAELAGLPSVLPIMAPEPEPTTTPENTPPAAYASYTGAIHDEDAYPMLCYADPPPSEGFMVHDGWPPVQPESPEPITWSLQSKADMLLAQIRMYTRLRAECMQALMETKARIAMLTDKE